MRAKVGDEIVVGADHTGDAPREGEILEILNSGDVLHYRVRWDDGGHEAIFYPGSTTHIVRVAQR